MIGYVMLGTNDLARAEKFYDAVMGLLGARQGWTSDRYRFYGNGGAPMLAITIPHDGDAASVGNGTMVALSAASPAQVDAVHAKAMSLGATDEGAPGPRGTGGFYGAYFRDPDGNKLCVFNMAA